MKRKEKKLRKRATTHDLTIKKIVSVERQEMNRDNKISKKSINKQSSVEQYFELRREK